jgi:hypothetical protein
MWLLDALLQASRFEEVGRAFEEEMATTGIEMSQRKH